MRYTRLRGFTLTELLVVISIVVLLTALSIPSLIQMGVFSSNKVGNAAREYYEMLRAARMYATTHNVETALVYQARLVRETANDEYDGTDMVPVIEAYAVCRRLTPEEIEEINTDFLATDVLLDTPVFVPVPESDGQFRRMPAGTCILPEIFEVEGAAPGVTTRALSAVYVVHPALVLPSIDAADRNHENGYMRPLTHPDDVKLTNGADDDADGEPDEPDEADRLHFEQGAILGGDPLHPIGGGAAANIYAFPAHRFAPSGEMLPLQTRQRFQVRVGMLPNAELQDRFVTYDDAVEYDPDADPSDAERVFVQFHSADLLDPPDATETAYRFHDPRREPEVGNDKFDEKLYLENSVTLNIYTATGRVEITPTKQLEDYREDT